MFTLNCSTSVIFSYKLFFKLSDYLERKGDYGLNIDTDVTLWLDSRDFHKKHPLHCALGFVIVNSQVAT